MTKPGSPLPAFARSGIDPAEHGMMLAGAVPRRAFQLKPEAAADGS